MNTLARNLHRNHPRLANQLMTTSLNLALLGLLLLLLYYQIAAV